MSSMCIHSVMLSYIYIFSLFSTTVISKPSNNLAFRLINGDSILSSNRNPKLSSSDDIRVPVLATLDYTTFLVNISVGEPPVPQLMVMDTGSSLTWIQCKYCDSCINVYFPEESLTFSPMSSDSPECDINQYGPQSQEECTFSINYVDLTRSSGIIALEKFTFFTPSEGMTEMSNVVFGCAEKTSGPLTFADGIFGLEAEAKYSLVASTGCRFSYCIGSINDPGYMYNQLILGDGAVLQGDSTPMQMKDGHYVVTLEGINVGGKGLKINKDEFYYSVMIDSGATYIRLKSSAYQPLIAEVKRLMDGVFAPTLVRNAENQLCYKGDLERNLKGFPLVTLHLSEGTDINLEVDAVFHSTTDRSAFCMAVIEGDHNVIGVMAQQYYNVGFDLEKMRISFERIDCEVLKDQS